MHSGWLPVQYAGGLTSSCVMLLIGLCQTNIVILTCMSDIFPPDLPSCLFFEVEELARYCVSQLGLPVGAAGRTIQAASILLPM